MSFGHLIELHVIWSHSTDQCKGLISWRTMRNINFSPATQILAISSLRNHSFTKFWVIGISNKLWFCDFMLFIFNQTLKHKDFVFQNIQRQPTQLAWPNVALRAARHVRAISLECWGPQERNGPMAQTSHLFNSKTVDHDTVEAWNQTSIGICSEQCLLCVVWIPQP